MKKIIKWILQLVVCAAIVVGLVFGIKALVKKDLNNMQLVNSSNNLNISQKLNNSTAGFVDKVVALSYSGGDKVNEDVSKSLEKINNVLTDYYNYYIDLTAFAYQNVANINLEADLNALSNTLNTSIQYLNDAKVSGINADETNKRLIKAYNALSQQVETLFKTCENLKTYVYVNVYKTEVCSHNNEAVLEVLKDCAKVVFEKEIKNCSNASNGLELVNSAENLSFNKLYDNYIARSEINSNTEEEIKFMAYYMQLKDEFKQEYYSKSLADKNTYIADEINFQILNDEVFDEEATAVQFNAIKNLHAYLLVNQF